MCYCKYIISALLLTAYCVVNAQDDVGSLEKWTGNYSGAIQGTPSTLYIEEDEGQLSGKIDVSGYVYLLKGTVIDGVWNGVLQDPQTQGQMQFESTSMGGSIDFLITYLDPNTSQPGSFQLQFSKQANQIASKSKTDEIGAASKKARDQRLVGVWTYTDSYTSGEFSFATQFKMQINPDGTYLYGDAKVVGGGPGISGDSGGGDVSRGQWKTENQTIFINEGYGWQPYAGYYLERESLLLKFSDGSRQVWKRNY